MDSLKKVAEFHERIGAPVKDTPDISDDALNNFRVDFIQEELNELKDALQQKDMVSVLDALTDLQYVLDGAYLSFGLQSYKNAALEEVHRSNMSKAAGKTKGIKGESYSKPDLDSVLYGTKK